MDEHLTMTVIIDGEEVQRRISHREVASLSRAGLGRPARIVPVTYDDEEVMYVAFGHPIIVKRMK